MTCNFFSVFETPNVNGSLLLLMFGNGCCLQSHHGSRYMQSLQCEFERHCCAPSLSNKKFFAKSAHVDSSWKGSQQYQPSQQLLSQLYLSHTRRCVLTSNLHHFIEPKALQYLFFFAKSNNIDDLYQQHVCGVMDSYWNNSGGCFQEFWKGVIWKNIYFRRDLMKLVFSGTYMAT